MYFDKPIKKLNLTQRKWLMGHMYQVMQADGIVHKKELKLLESLSRELKVNLPTNVVPHRISRPKDQSIRTCMIGLLYMTAYIDGFKDTREEIIIREATAKWKLPVREYKIADDIARLCILQSYAIQNLELIVSMDPTIIKIAAGLKVSERDLTKALMDLKSEIIKD